MKKMEKYIILPVRGLSSQFEKHTVSNFSLNMLLGLNNAMGMAGGPAEVEPGMKVIDSIHEDGAKLVEMTPAAMLKFRAEQPGLKVVPLMWYKPASYMPEVELGAKTASGGAGVSAKLKVKIVAKTTSKPVAGATVVAFIDFKGRIGAQGVTNAQGVVTLELGGMKKKLEVLLVVPQRDYWGLCEKDLTIKSGDVFELPDIDINHTDSVRHFFASQPAGTGTGVRVGIIDTGVGPHPHLNVLGGENTTGEPASNYGDNGERHGTHVAGIVAGSLRGLAPQVELYSYRVFKKGEGLASNYAISKAIDRAVADGCDLINMSLGGGKIDEATKAAIEDARAAGTLAIVAAGNNGADVSFPASYQMSVAVSAMGRKGTFPSWSNDVLSIGKPTGTDAKNFIASFSNRGPEIDLVGPGVAVVSTVPPDSYVAMSGTSMACPAVTGIAARLLSVDKSILGLTRDQARSDAMAKLLFEAAVILGFGGDFEGHGMPD